MGKNIKLTPEILHEMVGETLKRILSEDINEVSYNTLDSARRKADPSWYQDFDGEKYTENPYEGDSEDYTNTDDVLTSINTIKNFLGSFEKEGSGMYRQYYPVVEKCFSYLDFIENFVSRKRRQVDAFEKGFTNKKEELLKQLDGIAKQNGFDNIEAMANTLEKQTDEESWDNGWEKFVKTLSPELQQFIEENM